MTEIDVSGCEYYIDSVCYFKKYFGVSCSKNLNCNYKRLKRCEQENAKLKEELAEANQLKDMYHTYYRAKHDDIKGIIFKQKEKLEKIKNAILYCGETDFCNICKFFDKCNGYVEEVILQIIEGAEDENS